MKKFMFIHKLNLSMFSLFVLYISITVFAVHAEIHHNILTVDATDRENWVYKGFRVGSGSVRKPNLPAWVGNIIRQHINEISMNALNRG